MKKEIFIQKKFCKDTSCFLFKSMNVSSERQQEEQTLPLWRHHEVVSCAAFGQKTHLCFVTHESKLMNSHQPARKDVFFFRVDAVVKAMLEFWTVGGRDQTRCGVFS